MSLPTEYQKFIHLSRYGRWNYDKKRRETWEETVARYFDFFEEHLKENNDYELEGNVRRELEQAIKELRVMPSMRCLMTAGEALKKENMAGYNCSYVKVDSPKSFDEILYVLMNGTGVGFSVERDYVNKLPCVAEEFYPTDTMIIVTDSKLGWAKSLRELISLLYQGLIPSWDLSKVRPAGAPLKTFGGRASGPEPLDDLFKFIIEIFTSAKGRKLKSVECHDIVCKIAEIVVVGGVRRSALISLSNLTDEQMRHAKSGQWWENHGQRALANNSVNYKEKPDVGTFMREWLALYESKSGERGIYNSSAAKRQVQKLNVGDQIRRVPRDDYGTNPCCLPGSAEILTDKGYVSIEKIIDDISEYKVLGYDHESNTVDFVEIDAGKMTRPNADLIELIIESEDGETHTLQLTPDHRVWTENRGYVEASKLTEDDVVLSVFRKMEINKIIKGRVKSTKLISNQDTFDIQTKTKNFFARSNGKHSTLVHNSEIILRSRETCNLSEVVVRKDDVLESLKNKVKIATILGTIQSTLTNYKYLSKEWKQNCEEERLLGVSMTGIMDNAITNGSKGKDVLVAALEELKQVAIETNLEWSQKLGINQSAAITCIKPSGTVSQLVDSASGIHARHNPYYIRTVRADNKDPLCQFMKDAGFPNEPDVMKPQHTTVFSFPMQAPEDAIFRYDMTALEQMELWKIYQEHWCEHKPSVTISVKEHEWVEVGAWVYEHFDSISGISFLPFSEHTYRQAPYQDCSKEDYEEALERMPKNVDWSKLSEYEAEDYTSGAQELACTAGVCEVVDLIA